MGLQQVIIVVWGPDHFAEARRVPQGVGPGTSLRRLAHQPVAGLIQIVRHLQRQNASRFQSFEQAKQNRGMVRHPLKTGIGKQQVGIRVPLPCRKISLQ